MQSLIIEVIFNFFTPEFLSVLATGLNGWHFFMQYMETVTE